MDEKFVQDRISVLHTKKGVSEYKMSLDLGHSKGYIQSISSGRSLPSLPEFLYICEYLGDTPIEFFDTGITEPLISYELTDLRKDMCKEDLEALIATAKRLKAK